MESFDIFSNKKDLIIFILGILLLLSVTGLYYIRELGEWLGKIIRRIYLFFYSLFATLFFSTGQIINASSNVVADAATLTIDIGNDAINDVGNLLKGETGKSHEHHEKKEDKHKENMDVATHILKDDTATRGVQRNMDNLSYMVVPSSITTPSTTTRPKSLSSIVQKGTPVPVNYEPSILEYWNIGGSLYK
uniref:Uncharacterized protein n=1 Tax=viral metagenome TaxID=1070528 RepID=A0A6C0HU23_9ZZZZ